MVRCTATWHHPPVLPAWFDRHDIFLALIGTLRKMLAADRKREATEKSRSDLLTGDVDAMIAIRSNFFYTRTVPCELWFLNRNKPKSHRDKILMLDARNVYRKVTRKIYDFSPEQEQNLLAIVWLYRGQTERFLTLVSKYLGQVVDQGQACFEWQGEDVGTIPALAGRLGPRGSPARNDGVSMPTRTQGESSAAARSIIAHK